MTSEPLDWTDHGPRSARFGDVYFSAVDGLAESRAVFLAGCGLPERWTDRSDFTVAELGFGTGLNILALLDLWRREGPPDGRLHIFSVEAFPIERADAARALGAWPELADLAGVLLGQWPDGRRGFCRIDFPEARATLDLAVADAFDTLSGWTGAADAWFLDGFAPARNPQMWREDLLAQVAAHTAPGGRAATFTVAGAVRRGLQAAGFAVEKKPGFGRKRERLEATLPGSAPHRARPRKVAVVGAGIAGAATVRALTRLGIEVVVVDPAGPGGGASGGPGVMVTPRLDAGLGPVARLHAQAFHRAAELYRRETPDAVLAEGVVQLERDPRDAGRFARIAAWEGYAPGALQPLDPAATAAALGEAERSGALSMRDALVVHPAPILDRWLSPAEVVRAEVDAVSPGGPGWRLVRADGGLIADVEAVVVATGPAAARLLGLPLRPVRGQLSVSPRPFEGRAAAWGGYAAPLAGGLLFGATHDRDDEGAEVRAADHKRNLELLARGRPRLAAALQDEALEGWAGVRAASPDHLPLAGPAPSRPGLYVLAGLGGRGFTLAPTLGEQIAAAIAGAPQPLPHDLAALTAVERFGV